MAALPMAAVGPHTDATSFQLSLHLMPATELTVTAAGQVAGKHLLIPSGPEGTFYPHIQDWVTAQRKAGKVVRDVSSEVLVKGIKQWAAYEHKAGGKTVRTVFKIT